MAPKLTLEAIRDLTLAILLGLLSSIHAYKIYDFSQKPMSQHRDLRNDRPMLIATQAFICGMFLSYALSFIDFMVGAPAALVISWSFFNLGFVALWLFLLLQIYYSFRNTKYGLTRNVIVGHIVMMNITEIGLIIAIFLKELESFPAYYFVAITVVLLASASFFHLAWSFHHKLFSLIVDNQQNTIAHTNNALSMKLLCLIPKIVKETVIAFNIVAGLLLFVLLVIMALISHIADPEGVSEDLLEAMELWVLAIMITLISFAMFVSFGATRSYYIVFCGKCENVAMRYWMQSASGRGTLDYEIEISGVSPMTPVHVRQVTPLPETLSVDL